MRIDVIFAQDIIQVMNIILRLNSKVFKFCRSKCHKHLAKHNPRKFKYYFSKIH